MGTQQLHLRSKQMKEEHVRKRGPSDLAPLMIVAFDDETVFLGTTSSGMSNALEHGVRMGDIIGASLTRLRQKNDNKPLRRAMLIVEGYADTIDITDPVPVRGDLAERFATEVDSTVSEALVTSVWNYDGECIAFETMTTRFHYTDGGVLVWGDDEGPYDDRGAEAHVSEQGRKAMR